MLSTLFLTSLLAVLASANPALLFNRATCNADNCLRAVRATNAAVKQPQASADCSSYFATTSNAAPLPTYAASVCTNSARYSSACDCAGFLPTPTTACNADNCLRAVRATNAAVRQPQASADCSSYFATSSNTAALPTYAASVCSSSARYSSACACAGYLATPTPTPVGCDTVVLRAADGPYMGQYLDAPDASNGQVVIGETAKNYLATRFALLDNGMMTLNQDRGLVLGSFPGYSGVGLFDIKSAPSANEPPPDSGPDYSQHALFWTIPKVQTSSGAFQLQGPVKAKGWEGFSYTDQVFQVCPGSGGFEGVAALVVDAVLDDEIDNSCTAFQLVAEQACVL